MKREGQYPWLIHLALCDPIWPVRHCDICCWKWPFWLIRLKWHSDSIPVTDCCYWLMTDWNYWPMMVFIMCETCWYSLWYIVERDYWLLEGCSDVQYYSDTLWYVKVFYILLYPVLQWHSLSLLRPSTWYYSDWQYWPMLCDDMLFWWLVYSILISGCDDWLTFWWKLAAVGVRLRNVSGVMKTSNQPAGCQYSISAILFVCNAVMSVVMKAI